MSQAGNKPNPKLPSTSANYTGTIVVDIDPTVDLDDVDANEVHSFHDSKVIPTTVDMTETTEERAREQFDAVPCSYCFRDVERPMKRLPGETA